MTTPDVPIVPDTRDWTWVLTRPCPECGFDAAAIVRENVGANVRANAAAWTVVLARPEVTVRPAPDVWSALEYGCHVRDVFRRFDERLELMLTQEGARFANWDQDETAIEDRYGEQDPAVVAGELATAGATIADRFDGVSGDQWDRIGSRSNGSEFTVDSLARYFLHDVVHHLHDVGSTPA
jgi:hypothetical protein